ncbi:MAG: type II toxin-antitoxin system PemK/MazF family toxin [Mycobacterium sp.]
MRGSASPIAYRHRGAHSGKPRPVVIVQDDRFDATAWAADVPFSTGPVLAPLLRLPVPPNDTTGLGDSTVALPTNRPSSLPQQRGHDFEPSNRR